MVSYRHSHVSRLIYLVAIVIMKWAHRQNSVEELFSLIKFLQIRPLNDWQTFNNQIAKPVKTGRSVRAMKRLQVRFSGSSYCFIDILHITHRSCCKLSCFGVERTTLSTVNRSLTCLLATSRLCIATSAHRRGPFMIRCSPKWKIHWTKLWDRTREVILAFCCCCCVCDKVEETLSFFFHGDLTDADGSV